MQYVCYVCLLIGLICPATHAQPAPSTWLVSTNHDITLFLDGEPKAKFKAGPQPQKLNVTPGKYLVTILGSGGDVLVKDHWVQVATNEKMLLTFDGNTKKLTAAGSGALPQTATSSKAVAAVQICDDSKLNDILLKHIEATGGLTNWQNVESVRVAGTDMPTRSDNQVVDNTFKSLGNGKPIAYSSFKDKINIIAYSLDKSLAVTKPMTTTNTNALTYGYGGTQPLLALAWLSGDIIFSLEGEENGYYKVLIESAAGKKLTQSAIENMRASDKNYQQTNKSYAFINKDNFLVERYVSLFQANTSIGEMINSQSYSYSDFRKAGPYLIPFKYQRKIVDKSMGQVSGQLQDSVIDSFDVNVPPNID